ncbi:MAG: hypothetical protein L0229_07325 [Blastocatellia bacterium]|nr:hypothetical protein [Blastocatellia bacterium]
MEKLVELPMSIRDFFAALMNFIRRSRDDTDAKAQAAPKIARYNLVLMDGEGQVVWTREWEAGDSFEFSPHYSLWIFCQYTNHSQQEVEVAEYEIELVSEEGEVVNRFGNGFGDAITLVPGQSKVFSGRWQS